MRLSCRSVCIRGLLGAWDYCRAEPPQVDICAEGDLSGYIKATSSLAGLPGWSGQRRDLHKAIFGLAVIQLELRRELVEMEVA